MAGRSGICLSWIPANHVFLQGGEISGRSEPLDLPYDGPCESYKAISLSGECIDLEVNYVILSPPDYKGLFTLIGMAGKRSVGKPPTPRLVYDLDDATRCGHRFDRVPPIAGKVHVTIPPLAGHLE